LNINIIFLFLYFISVILLCIIEIDCVIIFRHLFVYTAKEVNAVKKVLYAILSSVIADIIAFLICQKLDEEEGE